MPKELSELEYQLEDDKNSKREEDNNSKREEQEEHTDACIPFWIHRMISCDIQSDELIEESRICEVVLEELKEGMNDEELVSYSNTFANILESFWEGEEAADDETDEIV